MKHADAACYSAKEQGRNRVLHVGIDDPRMNARQGELQWVHRIQQAIENDNFVLFGQDIIPLDAAEERPRKEVLLRLAAPDEPEGYILPGAFLPAAERYGLGARLDAWVVSQLLSRLGDLTSAQANACSYWINLSGATFSDDKFFEFLERALATVDLLPGTINFEITETDVIRNLPEASAQIEKLNRLGCRFAMDDFGSGISSFGYLKNLPVDYIKIDGMFVRDIVNDEIDLIFVKSIIDIAKAMNLKTVAEYVCDERVLAKIRELGADYAQGYEISKPQPLFPA
jgi:EAL domain-containing protein (putative c-di-GMP-specific phosphodiesterase class I)